MSKKRKDNTDVLLILWISLTLAFLLFFSKYLYVTIQDIYSLNAEITVMICMLLCCFIAYALLMALRWGYKKMVK
ncbi:hypothetical protein MFLO_13745 [Listeria floridensis FSL S10-1187]|uniref:Uncharacterized protein n=1 Tax=Listeria floridensis FSL S10-1187 TaxID=1265817 RepID=A0ABN0RCJ2_9LIST|nr:hypothetical protein MFLO_13745 [Listeria floridensis FSL S10-1187]